MQNIYIHEYNQLLLQNIDFREIRYCHMEYHCHLRNADRYPTYLLGGCSYSSITF